MILRQATIKYKGYDPDTLSYGSSKRVCCSCDNPNCGRVRWVDYSAYRDLCKSCAQQVRFNDSKIIKIYSELKMGNKNPMYIELNENLICKEYQNGMTTIELGKKYNCTSSTISRRLKANNIKIRSKSEVQTGKNNSMYDIHLSGENSPNWKGGEVIKTCELCGKEFESKPSANQKCCSKKCGDKWKSENLNGKNSPSWKGGLTDQKYCNLWTKSFKESIRERFHNKCYLCDKSEKDNNQKLSVHQDKEKEEMRDNIIESNGWNILHFTGSELINNIYNCVDSIERLMKNHNGDYKFMWLPIKSIEIKQPNRSSMTWNLSVEEDESFISKGVVVHNCSIQYLYCRCLYGNPSVYTINGWERINKINIGDLVLTHKGRFRKVTQIHKHSKKENKYHITTKFNDYDKGMLHTLIVTPEHPFLTKRGWIEAKDLINTDMINVMADECKNCGKLYPLIPKGNNNYLYNYCSSTCGQSHIAKLQWADPNIMKDVPNKISKSMKNQYDTGERSKERSPEHLQSLIIAGTKALCKL